MTIDNFIFDNRYHYSQFNKSEQRFYKFMVSCLLQNQKEFIKTTTMKGELFDCIIPEEYQNLPKYNEEIFDFSNVYNLLDKYEKMFCDCPEFYYLVDRLYFDYEPEKCLVRMGPEKEFYSNEEINEINEKLDEIIHKFDHINDNYELILAVDNYISENIKYDNEMSKFKSDDFDPNEDYQKWKRFKEAHMLSGVVKYKMAVCDGITRFAQYILQKKGLETIIMNGHIKNSDTGHEWMLVKLDDEYYSVDFTWSRREKLNHPPHAYLLNEYDDVILELDDLSFEIELLKNNGGTKHNYYRKNNLYYNTLDELEQAYSNFIDKNIDKKDMCYFYFKTNPHLSVKDINLVLEKVENEKKISFKKRTYARGTNVYAISFIIA